MSNVSTKVCSLCGRGLPLSEFYQRSLQNGIGPRAECKDCCGKRSKRWYEANTARHKKLVMAWADKNRDLVKSRRRRGHLKKMYGITPEDYDRIFLEQEGRCGICGTDLDLVVDHDHTTGRVRGLLCRRCNRTLGQFEDDRELVRRALEWLED